MKLWLQLSLRAHTPGSGYTTGLQVIHMYLHFKSYPFTV